MGGLPTFGDPTDPDPDHDEASSFSVGSLIPWLPDPETCPECDTLMNADTVYDSREARYVHAWTCPACDTSTRRDPEHDDQDAPQPSRGSAKLRSLFT